MLNLLPTKAVIRRVSINSVSLAAMLIIVACKKGPSDDPRQGGETRVPGKSISSQDLNPVTPTSGPRFTTMVAEQTGVNFSNRWNPKGQLAGELTGPFAGGGVAIGDFDDDGRPDVYLTRPIGGSLLYRNLGGWRFEDVTGSAGLSDPTLHGTGASFVDIDNDGDLDLHVCCYDGPNRLYVNGGDGRFINRAEEMGLALTRASVMCSFADYDGDGDLDAYLLTNSRPPKSHVTLRPIKDGDGWTVPPEALEHKAVILRDEVNLIYIDAGEADHLMRNNGDGTFSDVAEEVGMSGYDIGLSATWIDANDDGRPDLYVANDFFTPDHLWINNGKSGPDGRVTFTDTIAESLPHTPWYSMGSDAADINNDGLIDMMGADMAATSHFKSKITMGNMQDGWFLEYPSPRQYMRNAVYLNTGTSRWMEVAHLTGLANTDWTWAIKFGDLDNDGFVDLFVANGMTRFWFDSDLRQKLMEKAAAGGRMDLESWMDTPVQNEANLAYKNRGDLNFESVGKDWGLDAEGVSFGAALGDLDGDGDLDLIVNNFEAPVGIYRNNSSSGHRLALRLKGTESNSFGIGAKVEIETADGIQVRSVAPYGGFYSCSEPLVHFGLGEVTSVNRLSIRWPSGRRQTFENLPADCLYTISEGDGEASGPTPPTLPEPLFKRSDLLAEAVHTETRYDDFQRQPLLPSRLSQLGPGMAWGDVDGDGDDDFYLSGAKGAPGQLFHRDGTGKFQVAQQFPAGDGQDHEEMSPIFFDADGDRDLDLFVVSGGVECEPGEASLRDRLYLNDGKGRFTAAAPEVLPDLRDSGSVAVAADFDRDGDLDLFVGSRSIPGSYPLSPRSRLLRNNTFSGGQSGSLGFTDVTDELASGLGESGMVTGALWSDVDGDGWSDLVVTHDWGPVRLWRNDGGKFTDGSEAANLSGLMGWWNGITGGDIDADGDIDYVVTNFGLNSKYHASSEKPTLLYYGDFEGTGKSNIVEAKLKDETILPMRGKSCSTGAMPSLRKKFPTFHSFARASLDEIYTKDGLEDAVKFSATELRSGVLINDGSGKFEFRPLPRLAQASPGFGVALTDVDCDGRLDLYLVQNFFSPQAETGRMDGGLSLLLAGNGDGTFDSVWPKESGLIVPEDAKSLTVTDLGGDGWPDFVVGVNDGSVIVYENAGHSQGAGRPFVVGLVGIRGNPTAIGARVKVHLSDNSIQSAEVYAGSGYLSQSPARLTFGIPALNEVERIDVHWPDGKSTEHTPSGKNAQITIRHPLSLK